MADYIYAYARPFNFSTEARPFIISFNDESIVKEGRKTIKPNEICKIYSIYGLPMNKKYYEYHYKVYSFYSSDIDELTCSFYPPRFPHEGAFVGYKIIYCKDAEGFGALALCTLLIENNVKRFLSDVKTNSGFYQCYANRVKVLNIVTLKNKIPIESGVSYYSPNKLTYKVGKYTIDLSQNGIYFFLTPQEAICHAIWGSFIPQNDKKYYELTTWAPHTFLKVGRNYEEYK